MSSMYNGITIHIIQNMNDLLLIEHQWNGLVNKVSNNPFLLSKFAKQFIEQNPKGWTPIILAFLENETIIGIAPLKTRKSLMGRYVDFLNPSWCSDFIFDEKYKSTCINYLFDFLFNSLKINFAFFTLSIDSPNLKILTQECESHNLHMETKPEMGRRILHIKSEWTEYEASLPRKYRKEMRRTERNLSKVGLWSVRHIDGRNRKEELIKKIDSIEKRSWKEVWRNQEGEDDWILRSVIEAAGQQSKITENFEWGSWFLELEGKNVAYTLVIKYKQVSYFVKTSYDEQFKKFYPGIVIQNFAIHQQFIEQNEHIDFLSDLSYLKEWTNDCLPRISIQLTKGAMHSMIHCLLKNRIIAKVISIYSNVIPTR